MKCLGVTGDQSLRSISEVQIVNDLLRGGWIYEVREGKYLQAVEATVAALARWVTRGLPVRTDHAGSRYYDPVEVLNFMKWSSLSDADPFWCERFVTTGRRFLHDQGLEWPAPVTARPFGSLLPRRFAFRLKRNFNLTSLSRGAPVRLRLPLPIEDATLGELRLNVIIPPAHPVRFSQASGRLEARLDVPENGQISLAYHSTFLAQPHPGNKSKQTMISLNKDEFAIYTKEREGFINITPRIVSLAQDIVNNYQDCRESVNALWNYVLDHVNIGAIHYHEIDKKKPIEWVLDNVWCNCELGTALFVSLCRSIGLPARIISGYIMYQACPIYHFWAEVWLEEMGWLPYDLLSWDLSAGGRDRIWRDCLAGNLDYRVKIQILPQIFVGPMSLRLPERWHLLAQAIRDGIEITLIDVATGELIYSDEIVIATDGLDAP